MEQILKGHLKSHRYKSDIGEAIFVLVLNRILESSSKRRAELMKNKVIEEKRQLRNRIGSLLQQKNSF